MVLRAGETFQINSLMLSLGCMLEKSKFGGRLLYLGYISRLEGVSKVGGTVNGTKLEQSM